MTPDEIANLMRRIEVAALLIAGFTYDQIAQMLGVGRGKVTNVQKSLMRSGEGYKIVIKRSIETRKKRLKTQKKKEKTQRSSFKRLKQRYPWHFLLFNLIDEISEPLENSISREKEALLSTPSSHPFKQKETKNR